MKDDEKNLMVAILKRDEHPRYKAERLGINEKRAEFLYRKWATAGWYEWGVSARTGWLTEAGIDKALQVAKELLDDSKGSKK